MIRIYPTDLTKSQVRTIKQHIPEVFKVRSKYNPVRILNAILYLIKTGCQWVMLPKDFPKWRCVYHHFRMWCDKGVFAKLMIKLTRLRRMQIGKAENPVIAVADSQSVKWGLIQSQKGVDGGKKVKGIKRHIIVDSQGLPLAINITSANVHDTKGIIPAFCKIHTDWQSVMKIKADLGYRGSLANMLPQTYGFELECVKSNHGSSQFIPIDGRWVVERTFSWLDSFRRITRNYEKYIRTAHAVTTIAFCLFLLRYL